MATPVLMIDKLQKDALDAGFAAAFDGEMPGKSAVECGNYINLDVELGKTACRELLRSLRDETYDPKPILGYRIISRGSTL